MDYKLEGSLVSGVHEKLPLFFTAAAAPRPGVQGGIGIMVMKRTGMVDVFFGLAAVPMGQFNGIRGLALLFSPSSTYIYPGCLGPGFGSALVWV
jgi:hypothetical protein